MDFPDLRIIVARLGHPWEEDLIALLRKSPNMYADIPAVHYRPWRYWQAIVTAMEYGVTHKLLLASDFPSATKRDPGADHQRELEGRAPLAGAQPR